MVSVDAAAASAPSTVRSAIARHLIEIMHVLATERAKREGDGAVSRTKK